jgi:hypothetical protein
MQELTTPSSMRASGKIMRIHICERNTKQVMVYISNRRRQKQRFNVSGLALLQEWRIEQSIRKNVSDVERSSKADSLK